MGEAAAAGCEGKVCYSSFSAARRAQRKRTGKVTAYRCRFCHGIHLGRTLGEGRRPKVEEPVEIE